MWAIEFSSERFRPYLPERAQVNPGVYGFELAAWLSQELMRRGVPTSYPISEDWGWLIEYVSASEEGLMIGCSSQSDPDEGAGTQPIDWHIFIRQGRKPNKKLVKPGAPDATAIVGEAVKAILAEANIPVREAAG